MRYRDKVCAECGAEFAPTSGRQRFCEFHRKPKFATARDSESKRRRRNDPTAEESTRPPRQLPIFGPHRRRERTAWIADALRLARRLHRDGRLGLSQEVVGWAERTGLGDVKLVGCHHLGSIVDSIEFDCYGPHVMSEFATQAYLDREGKRGQGAGLSPAEAPPEMSVSGDVRHGPPAVNCSSMTGAESRAAVAELLGY
jgi:hypothetical protein